MGHFRVLRVLCLSLLLQCLKLWTGIWRLADVLVLHLDRIALEAFALLVTLRQHSLPALSVAVGVSPVLQCFVPGCHLGGQRVVLRRAADREVERVIVLSVDLLIDQFGVGSEVIVGAFL